MKKLLSLLPAFALLLALCACGEAPGDSTPPEELVKYTDDTGRTVELPKEITRVAVTGPMTQIVVFALAPDLLVGTANEWDPGAEAYFDPKYFNLPTLGQLYGGKGSLNLEELLAAAPQVVIDVGEPKSGTGEDLQKLSEQTAIPFVHIDATTDTMAGAFRRLGVLLNRKDEAETLAAYCEETIELVERTMNAVGNQRLRLLYLLGDKGLNVIADGSYHGEIFRMLGTNAAVVNDPSSRGTGNETDMEQLLLWDPDFIIFSHDSIADTVGDDPVWRELTAIREGNYAKAPYGPYNWMGFPPSVQRYPGMLWLLDTLYPAYTDFDLRTEVDRYFALFYHCTLTDEQYAAILGG